MNGRLRKPFLKILAPSAISRNDKTPTKTRDEMDSSSNAYLKIVPPVPRKNSPKSQAPIRITGEGFGDPRHNNFSIDTESGFNERGDS
jgi:hypothetical protein